MMCRILNQYGDLLRLHPICFHGILLVYPVRTKENTMVKKTSIQDSHLGIDDKYLALRDSNLPVTKFISVSIAKPGIEWVIIRREKSFDILQNIIIRTGVMSLRKIHFDGTSELLVFWKLPLDKQS